MSTNLSGTTLTLGNTSLTENTLKALNDVFYVSGGSGASSSTKLTGTTLRLGNTSLTENTLKAINDIYYVSGSSGTSSSTKLTGTTLTLGNTSLTENTLKAINTYFEYKVGDTIRLDGIECICIALGVTIRGSNLTRIAIDRKYDLGYYQQYVGTIVNGTAISQINKWRWGGHGTQIGNTSEEVGYGLQNTINCLNNNAVYSPGLSDYGPTYPLMWVGIRDFRSSHSDKWFVPSVEEWKKYVYPNRSKLSFDTTTGCPSTSDFWSSSEYNEVYVYPCAFEAYFGGTSTKSIPNGVRLCRAF